MKKYKLFGILVLFLFLFSECENKSRLNEKIQITENIINYLDTTNYEIEKKSNGFFQTIWFLNGETDRKYGKLIMINIDIYSEYGSAEYYLFLQYQNTQISIHDFLPEIKFKNKNELIEIIKNYQKELEEMANNLMMF